MLRLVTTLALLFTSLTSYADFVQDRDLISLHYDHAPDRDDGHATVSALAVTRALGITPHVVSGTYGIHNRNDYQPESVVVMRATWGSDWLDADANRQSSVNSTAARWRNILVNGGDIWVAEGGQSDFTADVVRSIRNTNPGINTNNRIHVIQHSGYNEEMSDQADLNFSRANTDYVRIADGNGANATADLNQRSNSFVALARASEFGSAWNAAFNYLNPNNKLDFSDTVELLHILDIGRDQIATVDDFGAMFLDNSPTPLATSPTAWSDSYSVDGQCHCDTNFDHGLNSISVDTPVGQRSVRQICADITSTFGTGSFENRVYFNTVQCGHEPANNAGDETICPGIPRGLNNYTGSRCNQTGATWNLDVLYAAPVIEAAPAPAPAPTIETPVAVAEPEVAQPVPQPDTPVEFPSCTTADSDADGDGFGFENNQSCIVTAQTSTAAATPVATPAATPAPITTIEFAVCQSAESDPDGDGFGFENNQSCTVTAQTSAASAAPVAAPAATPTPATTVGFAVCQSADSDPDGDGFGFENNQSCTVTAQTSAASAAPVATPAATPTPATTVDFAVCQSADSDPDGDGFGFENNQSCIVTAQTSSAPIAPAATTSATPAPVALEGTEGFPVCQSADSDPDGDGFGWENSQTCIVTR